jgi:hypothetical protein
MKKKEIAATYTTEPKLDKDGKTVGKETQTMPGWEHIQFSSAIARPCGAAGGRISMVPAGRQCVSSS